MPSSEKSPVRDSDAPIEIGDLFALEVLELEPAFGELLLLLLHAARVATESAAAAPIDSACFVQNQGRSGLTPGSSFLRYRARRRHPRAHSPVSVRRLPPAAGAARQSLRRHIHGQSGPGSADAP